MLKFCFDELEFCTQQKKLCRNWHDIAHASHKHVTSMCSLMGGMLKTWQNCLLFLIKLHGFLTTSFFTTLVFFSFCLQQNKNCPLYEQCHLVVCMSWTLKIITHQNFEYVSEFNLGDKPANLLLSLAIRSFRFHFK